MVTAPKSRVLDKGLWGMSVPILVDQAVTFTLPLIAMISPFVLVPALRYGDL